MADSNVPKVHWAGNLHPGDTVVCRRKRAQVADVPSYYVSDGEVPLIYDGKVAFITAPLDELRVINRLK